MKRTLNFGLIGALAISGGFLLTRLAHARGVFDYALAFGTFGAEVGVLIYLEWNAREVRTRRAEWMTGHEERDKADALLAAAKNEVERRKERIQAIQSETIALENEHLKGRVWNTPQSQQNLAIAAVREGFAAGIAANRARSVAPKEVK